MSTISPRRIISLASRSSKPAPRCPRLRQRAAASVGCFRPESAEEHHLLVAVARRRAERRQPHDGRRHEPDLLVALALRRLLPGCSPSSTLPAGSSHSERSPAYRILPDQHDVPGSGTGSNTTDRGWRTMSSVTSGRWPAGPVAIRSRTPCPLKIARGRESLRMLMTRINLAGLMIRRRG